MAWAQTVDKTSIPDAPAIMLDVAHCESGTRQYDFPGHVLTSQTNDVGYFQINKSWRKKALALGYDIMTPEGNIGFALWLYHTRGLRDWSASKHCWGSEA